MGKYPALHFCEYILPENQVLCVRGPEEISIGGSKNKIAGHQSVTGN
jgi:hypothetical protein